MRDFATMQESYKQIQSENYQLRDYIISLQSRLIESQGEDAVPPAPAVLVHPSPPLVLVDTSSTAGGGMMHQSPQPVPHSQPPPPQQLPVQPQPIQPLHQAPINAPTANMGIGHPSMSTVIPLPQSVLAAAAELPQPAGAQKRAHDDATDQAFLQSIAQAAGTGGSSSSFIATNPPNTTTTPAKATTSPAAKRVKGEKLVELKTEPEHVNGA